MKEFDSLDKLDRKILFELDLNSRIPTTSLAKKLKVSREVVDYRIKRLIENKCIRSLYTHIHSEKLGYTSYRVYFKIKGMDAEQEGRMIGHFCKHNKVFWVMSCNGSYDLIVQLTERDVYKLNTILQEFLQKYDSYFISKDITIITRLYDFKKAFLNVKAQESIEPQLYGVEKGYLKVDEKDNEILKLMSNNARIPVTEIAKKLNITSSAIIYRIKELEKKKIITGYSCTINTPRLGLSYSKVLLSLHLGNKNKLNELHQYCLQHKNVIRVAYCIGHWDFELDVMTERSKHFHQFLKELKDRFSDLIRDVESVNITQSYKFDHFPDSYPSELSYT